MISTIVAPGEKVSIIRHKNIPGAEEEFCCDGRVIGFLAEEDVKIRTETEEEIFQQGEAGGHYRFVFYCDKGAWSLTGEIKERYKEGKHTVVIAQFDTDPELYKKRRFFRLNYIMEAKYQAISPKESHESFHAAIILDISGGGCRFNAEQAQEAGREIELRFSYPLYGKKRNGVFRAKIISAIAIATRKGYYEYRVEFTHMDLKEKENLIRFIFEEEHKNRKQERGKTY